MKLRHRKWVQVSLIITSMVPAWLCQSLSPMLNYEFWESASESAYLRLNGLLEWAVPADSHCNDSCGKVAIIRIGEPSFERLGKPIQEHYFVQLFAALKDGGYPWVVNAASMKAFKNAGNPQSQSSWQAVLDYKKVIDSSAIIQAEKMYSNMENVDRKLLAKAMISVSSDRIPFVPIVFDADEKVVESSLLSGTLPAINMNQPYCFRPFYKDVNLGFVIPSSLLWAAAVSERRQFVADERFQWPSSYDMFHFRQKMNISSTVCLDEPQLSTAEYLQRHDIFSLEFSDVIRNSLKGVGGEHVGLEKILAKRTVILIDSDDPVPDPFVAEHSTQLTHIEEIYARYLDGLMRLAFLNKPALSTKGNFAILPLVLGLVLMAASFILSFRQVFLLIFFMMVSLILSCMYHIGINRHFTIPIQAIASMTMTLILGVIFWVLLVVIERRRLFRLVRNIDAKFSQANSLAEVQNSLRSALRFDFKKCDLVFVGFDRKLHEAAADNETAVEYLGSLDAKHNNVEKAILSRLRKFRDDQVTSSGIIYSIKNGPKSFERQMRARISLAVDFEWLGYCDIKLQYIEQDYLWVLDLLEALRESLSLSVSRIQGLAIRSLSDQAFVQRSWQYFFLSKLIPAAQFNNLPSNVSFNGNFERVMNPQSTKVGMLSISYYTRDEMRLSREDGSGFQMLQKVNENLLNQAREFGLIKWIGNTLWVFVDEVNLGSQKMHEFLIAIAETIDQGVKRHNAECRDEDRIRIHRFLHCTQCLIGNMLNDSMIDFSVIGHGIAQFAGLEFLAGQDPNLASILAEKIIFSTEIVAEWPKDGGREFQKLPSLFKDFYV